MPQTTTLCPRCRQPVAVDVEQLFDMNVDPKAKQKLLSGNFNVIRCPSCGYEGVLSTPMVYHDPEKELLLTYFPPNLGLPVNEQERLIGPLITQVTSHLAPEKRKAYLLRPQTMLTMDTMIERILEADGITKEMLQSQQQKLNLLQRLLSMTQPEDRQTIIEQEKELVDQEFFGILSRLIEATLAQGDQQTARQLSTLQQELLALTPYGKELQEQASEAEAAIQSLQEASKNGLTREKLIDLLVEAPSDIRLSTLVSVARSGMDYNFFQLFTERIEATQGEEKKRLESVRDKVLEMTREIDEAVRAQVEESQALLGEILQAPNIEEAVEQNLQQINEIFVQLVQSEHQVAREQGDLEKLGKLQEVIATLQKYSAPPPEVALIEKLINAAEDAERRKILEENAEMVTPDFLSMLSSLAAQGESEGQSPEVTRQLKEISRLALRFSMQENLKK